MRILLVEDTIDLGEAIVICLERMGHAVDWAQEGQAADDLLKDTAYELVVLDLTLPLLDGTVVLKRLRARSDGPSVLVVTARGAVEDRVGILDLGADDYLIKPFDFRELEARVRSLLRRRSGGRRAVLACAGVQLDRNARTVAVNDVPVSLTRREISLLEVLLASQGRVTSKVALIEQLFDHAAEPNENAIEVIITRLRPKLAGSGASIRTYRGLGYRIEPDHAAGPSGPRCAEGPRRRHARAGP